MRRRREKSCKVSSSSLWRSGVCESCVVCDTSSSLFLEEVRKKEEEQTREEDETKEEKEWQKESSVK